MGDAMSEAFTRTDVRGQRIKTNCRKSLLAPSMPCSMVLNQIFLGLRVSVSRSCGGLGDTLLCLDERVLFS